MTRDLDLLSDTEFQELLVEVTIVTNHDRKTDGAIDPGFYAFLDGNGDNSEPVCISDYFPRETFHRISIERCDKRTDCKASPENWDTFTFVTVWDKSGLNTEFCLGDPGSNPFSSVTPSGGGSPSISTASDDFLERMDNCNNFSGPEPDPKEDELCAAWQQIGICGQGRLAQNNFDHVLEYLANKNTREGNLLVKARDAICGADMYDRHRLEEYVIGYYMMSVVGYRIPLGRYLAAAEMLEEYGLAEDEYIAEVASNMRVYREVEELIGRTDLLDDSKAEALGVYLELISSPGLKNIILWDFINTPDSYWPLLRDAGIQMMHELVSVIDPGADFNSLVGNFLGIEKTNTLSFFAELIEVANQGISGFEPKTVATSAQDLAEILTLLWGQIIENIPVVNDNLSEYYSMDVGEAELVDFLVNVASGCPDLSCLQELFGNAILQTNLMYLEKQLQKDPMFLIKNCGGEGSPVWEQWQNMLNFQPPQEVYDKLREVDPEITMVSPGGIPYTVTDFWIQELKDAKGKTLNMDYFPVNISRFPNNSAGEEMTPEEFLQTVRHGWATEQFFGENGQCAMGNMGGAEFSYYFPEEEQLWLSNDPMTTIFSLKMPDDGAVIVSDYNNNQPCNGCWTVSTLHAPHWFQGRSWTTSPDDGYHPVSGHRQFGLTQNADGTHTFYTIGVDRMTEYYHVLYHELLEFLELPIPFETADALWRCAQQTVKTFVEQGGGSAVIGLEQVDRNNYKEVFERLKTELPMTDLPCVGEN